MHREFLVPANVATLQIRSFFPNPRSPKRDYGWSYISDYDLTNNAEEAKPSSSRVPTAEK